MQTPLQDIDCKVMIVDDSSFRRNMLRNILEFIGCKVIAEAQDGCEAVDKYIEFRPEVTVMNVALPGKDGLEATTEMLYKDKKAKIVMCSSLHEKALADSALNIGAKDVITYNPYDVRHIREVLGKVIHS